MVVSLYHLLEPILNERTNRTRGARGGSKLPRTLVSFRHCLAEPRQPRKKNTPCFSDLAGVKFLLKKERVFFFRGSALQVFGQCGGASIRTRFCENYFLGIWIFAKPRLICFWILSARRRGLGRNFPFAPLFVLGEFGADRKQKIQIQFLYCAFIGTGKLCEFSCHCRITTR